MKTDKQLRFFMVAFVLLLPLAAFSQMSLFNSNERGIDSIAQNIEILDSAYLNRNIIDLVTRPSIGFRGHIRLSQTPAVENALQGYISNASKRNIPGYRIRIFFDNQQNARRQSEELLKEFQEVFPGIAAYWTYDNPYFKVTVGDLRTKSEAMKMLLMIGDKYPAAFIVKDNINFPVL